MSNKKKLHNLQGKRNIEFKAKAAYRLLAENLKHVGKRFNDKLTCNKYEEKSYLAKLELSRRSNPV